MQITATGLATVLVLCLVHAASGAEPAALTLKAAAVKGSNAFAVDLYGKLAVEKGNLFFSPYSISTCVAMTYAGAKGKTAGEMAATMHYDKDAATVCEAYAALIREINGDGKPRGFQLSTANSLWGQKGYGFLPDYLDRVKKSFGAGLTEVDFLKDTEGSRKAINAWVEKETQEKIKDLIPPGGLDAQTRLVLANAIYFKAAWLWQFKKEVTKDDDFAVADGEKVKVPMMYQTERFNYIETPDLQILGMPYRDSTMAMAVLLPKKVDGLGALEKSLTAEKLAAWLGKLRLEGGRVHVTLPRFKMTATLQLGKTLAGMGMPLAFDPQNADFSGMNGGQEPLWIGAVIHKAFVDVNEEGTEAAAATAIAMVGAAMMPEQPKVFKADHPFLILIHDTASGEILFMGRVTSPKG
jgi:serpin B